MKCHLISLVLHTNTAHHQPSQSCWAHCEGKAWFCSHVPHRKTGNCLGLKQFSKLDGFFSCFSGGWNFFFCMVGAFTCVNVALSDLNNPSLYYYLEANLKSPGVMPTSQWLRTEYLPKVFDYHVAGGKKKLAGTISVSVVCDERGSAQDYYVLDALAIPSLNRDVNI